MIQKLKNYLAVTLMSFSMFVPALVPATVGAASIDANLCDGANLDVSGAAECDETQANTSVNNIITTVINLFSLLVGIISVIMIIIGGLKYIMSGGEGANITGAKNTILYAVIGLVIVALAQVIVRFVLARTTTAIGP